jgi:protein ImuB
VDRLACVDLPVLPLQLLLRQHPDWRRQPAAVVDRDKAQGTLLWVNEAARQKRILPGMRYATALSLTHELRAATIEPAEIEKARRRILVDLQCFSAGVEPSAEEPGVFWMDA